MAKATTSKDSSIDPAKILKNIKDSGLIEETTSIVKKAALVLEEEVARGIIAAKDAQKKLTNIDALKGKEKSEIIERFRKDAHDVVDSMADLLSMSAFSFEKIVNSIGKDPGKPTGPVRPARKAGNRKRATK